ncbi:MAG TPA: DHHA1 domain-containing protein [Nitrospira sp.]|nr:DHHA1 domain-containing protein [Nitrospira sp.]
MVCSVPMAGSHSRQHFSQTPTVVLYHAECADGFGAAWAIWRQFPQSQFIPVKHGNPPPDGLNGQRVVIVDFSYARETLESMRRQTNELLVLDHHITAEKALAGLPYAYFDLKKSGAVLAWEWAHDHPVPWLLEYIQDKDLWTWALPQSREINAAVASHPFEFQLWSSFKQKDLEQEGRAILRYEHELVNKLAGQAVLVEFHGETVPSVQSAVLTSQIGERLSTEAPFCIIWHDRDGRRYYSMRSREDGTDVGAIAASFGGGGHTHAAGFSVPLSLDGSLPQNPALPRPVIDRRRNPS